MRDPARVRVTGPLAPYAAGFEQELARLGYTPGSACRVLNLMAHASRWLAGRGLGVDDLGPVQVEKFFRARRQEGYVGHLSPKAMAVLIDHLGRLGVIGTNPCPRPPSAVDEVLDRYAGYLVAERGVAPATVRSYISPMPVGEIDSVATPTRRPSWSPLRGRDSATPPFSPGFGTCSAGLASTRWGACAGLACTACATASR